MQVPFPIIRFGCGVGLTLTLLMASPHPSLAQTTNTPIPQTSEALPFTTRLQSIYQEIIILLTQHLSLLTKHQPQPLPPSTATTTMPQYSPEATALAKEFANLRTQISPAGQQGNFSAQDHALFKQMDAIEAKLRAIDPHPTTAILQVNAPRHELEVTLNGVELGLTGGASETKRLFNTQSPLRLIAAPEVAQHNFALHDGENTLTLTYKQSKEGIAPLEIELFAFDNLRRLLLITVDNKTEGTITQTFTIPTSESEALSEVVVRE